MPSRPHSLRMRVESALIKERRKAQVGIEIESVPAILDLVQHHGLHGMLALNGVRSHGAADAFQVRPIGKPASKTSQWIVTSAQRPRGPLVDQSIELVREWLVELWSRLAPPA